MKPFSARELRARVKAHVNLAEERRRAADELNTRLLDLKKANGEVRDARRATLNVLEDVIEARDRAERLYEELKDHAAWLRGQSEALKTAVNGAPLETSLGVLARTARDALGQENCAAFYLTNGDASSLHHVVGMLPEDATAVDQLQMGSESLNCGMATNAEEAVSSIDAHTDPHWESWQRLSERLGYRGCRIFAINSTAGKFVGALAIYSPQRREASKREVELATLLTNTASIIVSRNAESVVRKRAEEALRVSQADARAVLEGIAQTVAKSAHGG